MGRLDGQIAIITGGSRGQGAATARIFSQEGARVVIADVIEEEGQALAAEIGAAAHYHFLDVADEASWRALVQHTETLWGAADILINNAAILRPASIFDLVQSDFEQVLRVNLIGSWLGTKHVASGMIKKKKGAIVNICSTAAMIGSRGATAYASSKWALRGFTKTAAMELGHFGIRVNAIFPGAIDTVMNKANDSVRAEKGIAYTDRPLQRVGEPEEVARTSLFLASDESSYLCGAEIVVDGGISLGAYTRPIPSAAEVKK